MPYRTLSDGTFIENVRFSYPKFSTRTVEHTYTYIFQRDQNFSFTFRYNVEFDILDQARFSVLGNRHLSISKAANDALYRAYRIMDFVIENRPNVYFSC